MRLSRFLSCLLDESHGGTKTAQLSGGDGPWSSAELGRVAWPLPQDREAESRPSSDCAAAPLRFTKRNP